ncbi:thioredoxin family protein, partial [Flavobacteriales bacterium]|nr:thioredoxin family protein [Flavobacteriales bacterium]
MHTQLSYTSYRELIDNLVNQDKTTGIDQSEAMINYTKLNVHRMNRLDKHIQIESQLELTIENIDRHQTWLVISEAWCGDAAQNLPILNKLAELSPMVELQIILRDENLDIMDQHLTNGGRSIPKIIFTDELDQKEIAVWGPRPEPLQQLVLDNKKTKAKTYDELNKDIQLWYAKDKGLTFQREILTLLTKKGAE